MNSLLELLAMSRGGATPQNLTRFPQLPETDQFGRRLMGGATSMEQRKKYEEEFLKHQLLMNELRKHPMFQGSKLPQETLYQTPPLLDYLNQSKVGGTR